MTSFFSKWISKDGDDKIVVSRDEAQLSFLQMRWDNQLAKAFFDTDVSAELNTQFLDYQRQLTALEMDDSHPVRAEISLLSTYLDLYSKLADNGFYYTLDTKVEIDHPIPALLIFPLVKNAVQHGYNSMAERPLRIKITSLGNRISVEVSNRVNHHLASQSDTEVMDQYKKRLQYRCADSFNLFSNSNSATFKVNFQLIIG